MTTDTDDLAGEKPSTINAGFKRWLVVAALCFGFAFVFYYMIAVEKRDTAKQVELEENRMPTEIDDAAPSSRVSSAAIQFQESVAVTQAKKHAEDDRKEASKNEKTNSELARERLLESRRNERSNRSSNGAYESYNASKNSNQYESDDIIEAQKELEDKFRLQQFERALRSVQSEGSIGSDAAFYSDKGDTPTLPSEPVNDSTRQASAVSLQERQADIRRKLNEIQRYREKLESGSVSPAAPVDKSGVVQ